MKVNTGIKLTYQEVKERIESIGFKLLSKEYINSKTKLDIECNKGHKTSKIFYSIFRKRDLHNGCSKCFSENRSSERKIGIESLKKSCEKIGLKLLTNKYINIHQKVLVRCKNGHETKKQVTAILHAKSGCSKCHYKKLVNSSKQYRINEENKAWEKYKKIIEDKGATFVKYEKIKNRGGVITSICNNKHTFRISASHLNYRDSWCRKCYLQDGESKCEKTTRKVFEKIYGAKFPNVRPDWLINPSTGKRLELDGYNSELKICFEYNGEQHYNYITYFHNKRKTFENLQKTDKLKKKICAERGVKLIVIPYTETGADIEKFIKKQSIAINLIR